MSKLMKCISEPSANQYFDKPYIVGEKVIFLGDIEPKENQTEQYAKQFIRIKRLKPLEERVEFRKNFEFIS